jgi:hypothetical protein
MKGELGDSLMGLTATCGHCGYALYPTLIFFADSKGVQCLSDKSRSPFVFLLAL